MTTRQNLIDKLAKAEELVKANDEYRRKAVDRQHVAETEIREVRKQFKDLKERLSYAEMENQRLRGYIQRVQEDDVVREELVQVGDQDGERRLVPKRKSTVFCEPTAVSDLREQVSSGMSYVDSYRDHNYKPKHWITY